MPPILPVAYAFRAPRLRLAQLDQRGPWDSWEWRPGDSAWLGDYFAAKPLPHGGVIRIYEEDDRYVLVILNHQGPWSDYQQLHAMLLDLRLGVDRRQPGRRRHRRGRYAQLLVGRPERQHVHGVVEASENNPVVGSRDLLVFLRDGRTRNRDGLADDLLSHPGRPWKEVGS